MRTLILPLTVFAALPLLTSVAHAQNGPSAYVVPEGIVKGGQYIDRFLPMKPNAPLRSDVWGVDAVKPRDVATGVEDAKYSYWCTSVVKAPDGKYHNFVVRWLESSPKGHFEWPNSNVVHAVSDNITGPYKVIQEIGKGHNVTAYQAKDGTWILYVINGCYRGSSLEGSWTRGKLEFDTRGRKGVDMTNCTFAQRSDGSYLMVNRTGEVWISKDGNKEPYRRVSNHTAYPPVRGARFEDPVVWKDDVQYNLIVNDWFGRAAYYLRSRDGQHWDWDQGLAYGPGIFRHEDGKIEDWHKIERPRVFQDERGRATHMLFAVIDAAKEVDKPNDNHSSKSIVVGVVSPRTIVVHKQGDRFQVALGGDKDFDPVKTVDPASLRFGAPSKVDFGRTGAPLSVSMRGTWLVAEFSAADCGFQPSDTTAKLLAHDRKGGFVFGYSALPDEPAEYPLLSVDGVVKAAAIKGGTRELTVQVENFGLAKSAATKISFQIRPNGHAPATLTAPLAPLEPYVSADLRFVVPAEVAPVGATPQVEIAIEGEPAENALKVSLPKLP
ncbi:MAG: glycoside hydrolase family protein [Verrucomicrobia bacterium]|nr:glycoside hydrolase family protein [Verrucomicrobiota bacterium]